MFIRIRRIIFAITILVIISFQNGYSDIQKNIIIPTTTNFNCWEHHWMVKLDSHNIYKAVEIFVYDNEKVPGFDLVNIRLIPKNPLTKAINYMNNLNTVSKWFSGFYREMVYSVSGKDGKPKNFSAIFDDKDDKMVEISIQFNDTTQLTKGNLREIDNIIDNEFLTIFYREKEAFTSNYSVKLNGIEYGAKSKEKGNCYYNNKVSQIGFLAVLDVAYGFHENSIKTNKRVTFNKMDLGDTIIYKGTSPGFENYQELIADSLNHLLCYHHKCIQYDFNIEFNPPLPTLDFINDTESKFSISVDDHKDLVTGKLKIFKRSGQIYLEWLAEKPEWTKKFWLITTLGIGNDGNSFMLATEPYNKR